MIFVIGVILTLLSGIIGVINDNKWYNSKLDNALAVVCNIGLLMALGSFLTFAWKTLP